MTAGALAALIPLLTGLAAVVKWIAGYFSDTSALHRLQLYLERQKARAQVERERLLATYARIDREPAKDGDALLDDLNDKFKGPGDAPKP